MGSRQRPNETRRPRRSKRELTLELLDEAPNGWETTMVYPLPQNPSYELLEAARRNVLDFLDFNSGLSSMSKEEIAKTLRAGLEKLIEIAILIQNAPREKLNDMGPVDDPEIPF
jgi:hypothetical protein